MKKPRFWQIDPLARLIAQKLRNEPDAWVKVADVYSHPSGVMVIPDAHAKMRRSDEMVYLNWRSRRHVKRAIAAKVRADKVRTREKLLAREAEHRSQLLCMLLDGERQS